MIARLGGMVDLPSKSPFCQLSRLPRGRWCGRPYHVRSAAGTRYVLRSVNKRRSAAEAAVGKLVWAAWM